MGQLNSEEDIVYHETIEQFRKIEKTMMSKKHSDEYILRFLRGANFDLQKAKEAFQKNLTMRQLFQIDTITKTYQKPEIMKGWDLTTFLGMDKDGFPVIYSYMGRIDFKGLVNTIGTFDLNLYCLHWLEILAEIHEKHNKQHGRQRECSITVILDYATFSLRQVAQRYLIETGLELLRSVQELLPDIVHQAIMINVPVYFASLYAIFKPIIKMDLLEKIDICTQESSARTLLKYIDPDVLPAFLGGDRVDEHGDPFCSSLIKWACKIPEEDYGRNQLVPQPSGPDVCEISVPARSFKDIRVKVDTVGTKLSIAIRSNNYIHLQFLVQLTCQSKTEIVEADGYDDQDRTREEIMSPLARINAHLFPATDTIHCFRKGTYIFRFDNTSSWITSKHVAYEIKVIPLAST